MKPMSSLTHQHTAWRSALRGLGRALALTAVLAGGVLGIVGSGGGGGGSNPPPAFAVTGTSPTNGATGVAVSTAVSASFSENLANTPTLTLAGPGGNVTGAVSRSGSSVTFTPAAALATSTTYTATVSGATGTAGGMQSGSTSWSFTTTGTVGGGMATISGVVDFQSVPNNSAGNGGLLYANTTNKPIRGATVEIVSAGGAVLATGTSNAAGNYSLSVASGQSVFVRVRAQLLKSGVTGGQWDISVRDNTQADAVYVMDSAAFTPAAGATTRDLRAASGWGGSSYTGTRVAGPFAILDTIYDGVQKILSASPNANFPTLQLMWSVNNRPVGGNEALGEIGTSFFRFAGGQRRIYILGAANTDTDEYDRPVVAHEFGHYLQSAFSRDDSIGGPHSGNDRLDMRVAFSEGWGNAWSGMALASQYYMDSAGAQQALGFRIDLAAAPAANRGWFSEATVQYLMYTWHANAQIGFTPIFNVLANLPTTLPAEGTLSSIHHFTHYLKQAVAGQASAIDALLQNQLIVVTNPLGTGETNNGGVAITLPIYKTHTAALGAAQQYCVNDAAGTVGGEFNKHGAQVFIRATLAAAGARTVTAVAVSAGSDPDFAVTRPNGTEAFFEASATATEQGALGAVTAGTHVIVLWDYELTHNPATSGGKTGERCFNVTIN
jgi:hypothetical protein